MFTDPAVQDFVDQRDWLGLLIYYLHGMGVTRELVTQVVLVAFGLVTVLIILHWLFTRRWTKPGVPFYVGSVLIDLMPRKGKAIHVGIGGITGLGKSSSILPLLDLEVGVMIIALDNTRPISTRIREIPDGIEWSNEPDCDTAWNMLPGDPALVSEQLVAGWPETANSGHYRRIARIRMWDRLERADRDGEERSLPMLIDALKAKVDSDDPQVGRACRDWATKLGTMYRVLGPNHIGGTGDLDIVQAMRAKKKVLFRLNNYLHPEDAPVIGGMLLVQARRAAQEAGVPFILVVEEAGALKKHREHVEPLAQAARDRDVVLIIISQNLSKLPDEVTNNLQVWISFAQEDDNELKFAAKRLRLEPEELQQEKFKNNGERWAYVRAPSVNTQLVHIQEYKPFVPKIAKIKKSQPIRIEPIEQEEWIEDGEVPAINHWKQWGLPALPAPQKPGRERSQKERPPWWVGTDPDFLRFWGQMRRTNKLTPLWSPSKGVWWDEKGCLEWHGPLSKPKGETKLGRPRSNIGRKSVTVYIETARAIGLETEKTLDHCCANPVCVDPTHLEECGLAENNTRRPVQEAKLEEAWLERFGEIPEWWANRYYEWVVPT